MYDISPEFEAALRQSHVAVTVAEVYAQGVFQGTLPVLDGEVTIDRGSSVRRRCTLTVPGVDDLIPRTHEDWLWPVGNEIKLWRGIQFVDGSQELVPLGVFQISNPEIEDDGSNIQISLTGYDRARKISRAVFTKNYKIHKGTTYIDAIRTIIEDRMPDVVFNTPDEDDMTEDTPNILVEAGADPWAVCETLAIACGAEIFFDAEGEVILQLEPDLSDIGVQPVWSFIEGNDATFVDLGRSLDDEEAYNHFVISGQGSDNAKPVRGEAMDNDPSSPTYYKGPYGDVPYVETSQLIRTKAQADKAAAAMLRKSLGVVAKVSFNAVPNPALDGGDIVTVLRERSGLQGRFMIQTLSTPLLSSGTQAITCRDKKAIEWEEDEV